MKKLVAGGSYLVRTKGGQIYLGVFEGCEKRKYIGSKVMRNVEIFKDVCCHTSRGGGLSHFNYLHLLALKIKDTVQVEFDESKFLNMPKTELIGCFENALW